MDLPIELDFTLSEQDYSNSTRIFYANQPSIWIGLGLSAIFFVYGFILLFTSGSETLTTSLVVIALFPVLLLVYFVLSPNRVAKRIAQFERFTAPQHWRIDDEEVQITQTFGDATVKWSDFVGVVESKEYILLRFAVNRNAFQIVPKRAFASQQQMEAFSDLVKQKIGRGKK